jgi:MFS-type transporter involved in bile tolerance (Atg22 family)
VNPDFKKWLFVAFLISVIVVLVIIPLIPSFKVSPSAESIDSEREYNLVMKSVSDLFAGIKESESKGQQVKFK